MLSILRTYNKGSIRGGGSTLKDTGKNNWKNGGGEMEGKKLRNAKDTLVPKYGKPKFHEPKKVRIFPSVEFRVVDSALFFFLVTQNVLPCMSVMVNSFSSFSSLSLLFTCP